MAASLILALAGLPAGADPSKVGDDVVFRLGLYFVPAILILWLLMMAAISVLSARARRPRGEPAAARESSARVRARRIVARPFVRTPSAEGLRVASTYVVGGWIVLRV